MQYFVTGATGLIGRFLVAELVKRPYAVVYVLMREQSMHKFEQLKQQTGASDKKLIPLLGDVTQPGIIKPADAKKLQGKVDHVFHLAAVYDMNMSDEQGDAINNQGTQNVVEFTEQLGGDVILHHVSSVAVAGNDYVGTFKESMFDEGQSTEHPYYRTKFQSEKIVRESSVPWRVYRPGMVVGHSETGEMDKVDGPYYFFKTLQRLRDNLPKWLPMLMVDGGYMPIAPVDYVVNAMIEIAHQDDLNQQAFHLVQSKHPRVGKVLSIFLEAAHGPEVAKRFAIPQAPLDVAQTAIEKLPRAVEKTVSNLLGIPLSAFGYAGNQAVFDDGNTQQALKGSDVTCPDLADYAQTLWNYWETHLDLDIDYDSRLPKQVKGKTVMITGASSGIGFTTAKKLAAAGAKLILVARGEENLKTAQSAMQGLGAEAHIYPTDLVSMEAIDELVEKVIAEHGWVDILVNNAGRSIRRAVFESLDRFHDYERTMQLNYFGAIRLIMGLLPSMDERGRGQVINISSIGCLTNVPRFSAYVASKSALDAFTRCLSAEVKHKNIELTTIYMPLVRTPMIAPTKLYDYVPTLTPDQAGDMVVEAIVDKPKAIKSPLGTVAAVSYAIWPKVNDTILNQGFKLFPSSSAARGKEEESKPSRRGYAFARLFKGTYW